MATSTLGSGTLVLAGTTSGTTTVTATAVAGTTTLTLPAATDTLVGKATTDTLTNKTLTGAVMNGTLGATTPSTVAATTLTTSSTVTHNGGTANGVAYLNGSKVLTTGSALVFDGTNLGVGTSSPSNKFVVSASGAQGFEVNPNVSGTTEILTYNRSGSAWNPLKIITSTFKVNISGGSDALTIDTSGNLALGGTTASSVISGTATVFQVTNNNLAAITLNQTGAKKFSISSQSTSSLVFYDETANTERARIDSSGRLLVNTTTGTANTLFQVSSNGTKQSFEVYNNDDVKLYSLGTGTVTCSGGVLSFTSDERLKIADGVFSGGIEAVKNIVPQYFYWKNEEGQADETRPRELGFFAQNIQTTCGKEVVPDPHREDLHLGIHDRGLMAVLVSAIQEQQALITQLTARITALESA
jgi:hypothetical protein